MLSSQSELWLRIPTEITSRIILLALGVGTESVTIQEETQTGSCLFQKFSIFSKYWIVPSMERFFNIRDWWGNGITLWVVVLLLFSAPLLLVVLKDVSLDNDITTWLPKDDPDAQSLEWFSEQFERENRLIVSWDSSSLNDKRVEAFARALQQEIGIESSGIESTSTPHDIIRTMIENKVSEEDAIERLTGVLIGIGFLKVKLTPAGQVDESATKELAQLTAAKVTGSTVTVLPPVPTVPDPQISEAESEEEEEEVEPISVVIPGHDFQLRWPEMASDSPLALELQKELKGLQKDGQPLIEQVFFASGAPVAITVGLNNTEDKTLPHTMGLIESVAVAQGIPLEEIRMAGSPVSRVRLNEEAKRAAWNTEYPLWNVFKRTPILLSALISIIVSFTLLRSFRLSFLVTLASMYTCMMVVALIPLTGKSLNMVLIVLPDLLLVLTTSGAIHVANYWKHAVTLGEENPIVSAVKMAWQPCALASVTTAIGMASLLTAVLEPVQQFGFYSSIGCLVSLAMILIGFPSMMSVLPGRGKKFSEHAERESTNWGHFGRKVVHHRTLITTLCMVLFVFSLAGLRWFKTETKVIRYFPADARISRDYHYLEEGLSGIVSLDTVIRFDATGVESLNISERMELIRDIEQKVAAHPQISGTLSLADFRDPVAEPSAKASRRQKIFYGKTLQRIERTLFEEKVDEVSQFTRKATKGLDLVTHGDREVRIEEGDEVWRIRAQSIVTANVNYSDLTSELEQIVSDSITEKTGVDYLVTGMVPLFLRTQQAVLESLIKSFGLAFIVIAVVMIALLRNPISGLLAMLPNLFPVGVVFGIVAWMGVAVDMGTMITASVALGIAIDGTLHLLTWYRDGIRHGMQREDSVVMALQHCGPAMWQTSATIALGMVILAGADLLLISRFGILMAGLVSMALIADVVLLPALLGGWLGRIIQKNTPVIAGVQEATMETIEFPSSPSPEPDSEPLPVQARSQS